MFTHVQAAQAVAVSSAGVGNIGLGVLLIAMAVGIFMGLKSKKLTPTELLICGTFGVLVGSTGVGAQIRAGLASAGASLLAMVS
ncbi:MAG: hypothetical protein ACRC0L_10980 [Angustibacter sp.]